MTLTGKKPTDPLHGRRPENNVAVTIFAILWACGTILIPMTILCYGVIGISGMLVSLVFSLYVVISMCLETMNQEKA